MTANPTILTGSLTTTEGCASIADAAGNLLFYTDGSTIYNQLHQVMANGTGLFGNLSTTQSAIIVKQPGNATLYYVFTMGVVSGNFNYSIVDMSLAAGMGSVTIKNVLLSSSCTEKLTSVRHCNGIDTWVTIKKWSGNNYESFLLNSVGVNTTAVVSSIGSNGGSMGIGCLKFSPNGKKLAAACYNGLLGLELYDFDASTGIISNSLTLQTPSSAVYGCEFSPDGTKLYAAGGVRIFQWDICAGSNAAIAASSFTIPATSIWSMQLATNGKIYVSRHMQNALGVVNNPNVAGIGCNYVDVGQSVSPNTARLGLPNFVTSGFKPPPPPFTHTVSNSFGCQTASFTAPPIAQNFTMIGCAASGYSLTGLQWTFGDPNSGASNTSTLTNPFHAYTSLGTYTAQLVLYYSCGGGTDTIRQQINVNQPCISVSSTSITCSSLGSATVTATGGIGPYSYTWMPSNQSGSVATGLTPSTYTLTVFDFGNNFTYTATTTFIPLVPLSGSLVTTPTVSCFGSATGSASIINLSGGSGSQSYWWSNGQTTYTSNPVNSLSAGTWSSVVTDGLTGCTLTNTFVITQPTALIQNIVASSATACAGTSVSFTTASAGGTPSYTYNWTSGPVSNTHTVSEAISGTYVYTAHSQDANGCQLSKTISVDFIPNPTITVSNASICPLESGTLIANGASSYSWSNNTPGSVMVDNPIINTQYTVTGSSQSCTHSATAWIILKPVPAPVFLSNSPRCQTQSLNMSCFGGTAYVWSGPQNFSASGSTAQINPADPSHSGAYQVTVTAVNGCTASVVGNVTVHPTPSLAVSGSTVCNTQTLQLSASSFSGALYQWKGPLNYTSTLQNPGISQPTVQATGQYTVKVTSVQGCTNQAMAHGSVTAKPQPIINSNSPVCETSTLILTTGQAEGYSWSGPAGFSSLLQNPIINNVVPQANGVYSLHVVLGPCQADTAASVTVYALPQPTITSNTPVCETKSLQLNVQAQAISYVNWQGPQTYTSSQQYTGRDSCLQSYSGVYTVTVTNTNNCSNVASVTVDVLPNPTLTTTNATVCLNNAATITVKGANSYTWHSATSIISYADTARIQSAVHVNPQTYTVVGTAVNGCTDVATSSISTWALPVPGIVTQPSTARVCLGQTIGFTGSGGAQYQWWGPPNLYYSGQSFSMVALALGNGGSYTLQVTDTNGCRSYTNTLLKLDALPAGDVLWDTKISCIPFCREFEFKPLGGSNAITARWQLNYQNPQQITGNVFKYCFTKGGDYSLTGQLQDTLTGCVTTISVMVNVYDNPESDFEFNPINPVEKQDEVLFTSTSRGNDLKNYYWYFAPTGPGVPSYTTRGEHSTYLYQQAGNYAVALITENRYGCRDTAIKTIRVEPDFLVFVPNTFTPNGDDLNEVFIPVTRGIKQYRLQIYNRWGELLFQSVDPNQAWDGTYRGQSCKQDVYVWHLYLSALNGNEKQLNGQVNLVR